MKKQKKKKKIEAVTEEYEENEKQVAAAYYEEKDYQNAIATLNDAEEIFQDDVDYVSACQVLQKEYLEEYKENEKTNSRIVL
ncbi:MAG: hypothetical protein LUC50_08710 [Ruminococcus sp.]|nr:hypothetical protein [Ruminococcus sp.]